VQSQQPKRPFGKQVKDFFLGKPEQYRQVPTQTPQGMEALQQLLSGGMQGLQNPQAGFAPIEQQAVENFNTRTIPGIAERFSSLGSGSQRSSAFQGANTSASQGLERQLAAMKAQYGLENRQGLLKQLQLGLSPQFQTEHNPAQPGFLQNLGTSLLGPGLQGLATAYGSEAGKTLGGKSFGGGAQQSQPDYSQLIKMLLPLLAV
jgi:hypothetical protein